MRLVGPLDESQTASILEGVTEALSNLENPQVIFDLDRVTDSTLLGRAKLIELQELLASFGGRTVWMSRRPRFRGMALVVCHAAHDPNAKVVSTPEQAERWFRSTTDRIFDAHKPVDAGLAKIRAGRKAKR